MRRGQASVVSRFSYEAELPPALLIQFSLQISAFEARGKDARRGLERLTGERERENQR